jgi:hypothetical protein
MKEKFDQIELRLQNMIEGSILFFLPKSRQQVSIIHELVNVIKSNLTADPDGRYFAPSQYRIHIQPSLANSWISKRKILDDIARELEEAARDAGFFFLKAPTLNLVVDNDLTVQDFWIEIPANQTQLTDTTGFSIAQPDFSPEVQDENLHSSYLIVNSETNFRLGQGVVNIGRKSDNHLVLNDLRVSRIHAQIRVIKDHYVIFDLNSKGGTYVNGQKIDQIILSPGDVISISGVPLIFGQDIKYEKSNTENLIVNSEIKFQPGPTKKDH